MKILLLGASGQLGRELKRSLACQGELVALDRASIDLTEPSRLSDAVRSTAPAVIVNAAAYTAVDQAETEKEAARSVNATAPGILASEAKRLGALLIHYSTDYVFDGTKTLPYKEDDAAAPLSVYGQSKLEGELAIAATGARHIILRTSWVYGLHGNNFMKTMLRLGRERDQLRIVGDQIGAPTWTRHLADATAIILTQRDGPCGLYHIAARGEVSWYSYAELIFSEARRLGLLERIPHLQRIASSDYPLAAARPINSQLDCSRLQRDFGISMPDWRIGLLDCLADSQL